MSIFSSLFRGRHEQAHDTDDTGYVSPPLASAIDRYVGETSPGTARLLRQMRNDFGWSTSMRTTDIPTRVPPINDLDDDIYYTYLRIVTESRKVPKLSRDDAVKLIRKFIFDCEDAKISLTVDEMFKAVHRAFNATVGKKVEEADIKHKDVDMEL